MELSIPLLFKIWIVYYIFKEFFRDTAGDSTKYSVYEKLGDKKYKGALTGQTTLFSSDRFGLGDFCKVRHTWSMKSNLIFHKIMTSWAWFCSGKDISIYTTALFGKIIIIKARGSIIIILRSTQRRTNTKNRF